MCQFERKFIRFVPILEATFMKNSREPITIHIAPCIAASDRLCDASRQVNLHFVLILCIRLQGTAPHERRRTKLHQMNLPSHNVRREGMTCLMYGPIWLDGDLLHEKSGFY